METVPNIRHHNVAHAVACVTTAHPAKPARPRPATPRSAGAEPVVGARTGVASATPQRGAAGATFALPLSVTIRCCEQKDLRALEWFGEFTPHREIFEATFAAQERGEGVMLVAALGAAPIGQVWIDFQRVRKTGAGLIWALRVFPWFQGQGLGTRLLHAAEQAIAAAGLACAEIGVERENAGALRLYLRQGFTTDREVRELTRYRTPDGQQHEYWSDEIRLRKRVGP